MGVLRVGPLDLSLHGQHEEGDEVHEQDRPEDLVRGRGSVRGRGRGGGKGRVTTTLSLTSASASASA